MRKWLYLFFVICLLIPFSVNSQPITSVGFQEEDGSPIVYDPHLIKVTNNAMTDNADGTISLDLSGGGAAGDSITVNTATAIDTTANFKDTATVTWAVTDGGAGGPDDIEATVGTTFPELTIDAAGVNLDTDGDGALSISGLGNGFDEDLTFNFDDVENTVGISTGSGVTLIDFSAIGLTTTGDVNAANMKITGVFNAGADDDPADVYIHSGGGLWVYEDSNDFVVGAVCKDGAAEWQFDDDVNIGASGAAEDLILWGNLKTATPTTLSAAELDRLDGLTSAIIDNDKMDASSELLAIMDDETGSSSGTPLLVFNQNPTIAAMVGTGLIDFGGADLELPNTAGDVAPDAAGEIEVDTTQHQIAVFTDKEYAIPLLHMIQGPLALTYAYDIDTDYYLVHLDTTVFPDGIVITGWEIDATVADPTTELDANLMYCDDNGTGAFPGANATLIDVLDTTTGNASEGTMSNSDLGSGIIPADKILYIDMDADPTDTDNYWVLKIKYYIPES